MPDPVATLSIQRLPGLVRLARILIDGRFFCVVSTIDDALACECPAVLAAWEAVAEAARAATQARIPAAVRQSASIRAAASN